MSRHKSGQEKRLAKKRKQRAAYRARRKARIEAEKLNARDRRDYEHG